VCGRFHRQLGGTFWRAGYCHYRQRHAVHLCSVVLYLHGTGHQARAHHCLPPAEQRYGGAVAQADQGCPTCTWCGSCVAFPPSVGAAGPTCCSQGGFCSIFSGAGDWDTTGSSRAAPARARSSTSSPYICSQASFQKVVETKSDHYHSPISVFILTTSKLEAVPEIHRCGL